MAKTIKNKILYVMSDIETSDVPLDSNSDLETYAWLTGFKIAGLYDRITGIFDKTYKSELSYYYGENSIKQLLDGLFNIAEECHNNNIEMVVFFHNAKYDFSYIQYYILNECGLYNTKSSNYSIGKSCIDNKGVFYFSTISKRVRIQVNKKRKDCTISFKIADMYKIFPSKLADIGNSIGIKKLTEIFDYNRIIPFDYIPNGDDLKYFEHDIEIMCEAYAQAPQFFYDKLTIGGITKNYYLNKFFTPKFKFINDYFPNKGTCNNYIYENNNIDFLFTYEDINEVYNHLCDYAYKGGMTIANAKYVGKTIYNDNLPNNLIPNNKGLKIKDNIYHLDVNSLYPSRMENNIFPIGIPKIIHNDGSIEFENYLISLEKDKNKKCIIDVQIHLGCVKYNKMPSFLIGKDGRQKAKHKNYKAFYEIIDEVTEVMTLEEFEYLKNNHYDMEYDIITAYVFNTKEGLFDDFIDAYLYKPMVIALALIIYGIIFIIVESCHITQSMNTLEDIDYITAANIGLFQMLALIPGTSRSGSTVIGGRILGVSKEAVSEFSFFMAVPVMAGATMLKLLKCGFGFNMIQWVVLLIGTLVAFVVSVISIRFLMNYIKKHDFKAFGVYRIVLGILVIVYFGFIK